MKKKKHKIGIIKNKKRRSYKKYTLYYMIFGVIFITILLILSLTVFFNINNIKVIGQTKHHPDKIISVSKIKKGDNLILTNTKKSKDEIMKFFTNLDFVNVKKKFPSTIEIECVDGTPYFYYKKNKNFYVLVSKKNRIIKDDEEEKPKNIFKLVVDDDLKNYNAGDFFELQEEKQEKFEIIKNAIKNENAKNITKVNLKNPKVYITFENRIVLEIDDISKTQYLINLSKIMLKKFIGSFEKGKLIYLKSKKSMHFIPSNIATNQDDSEN